MEFTWAKLGQMEALIRQAREQVPSVREALADMHQGKIFTRVFSMLLYVWVALAGMATLIDWLWGWVRIYHHLERWPLVLAFFDHFIGLGVTFIALYMVWLRAGHIRGIPLGLGGYVPIQSAALISRMIGEVVLVLTLGGIVHAVLGVPESSWISSLWTAGGGGEESAQAGLKMFSLAWSGWKFVFGFYLFVAAYTLAGVLEVFLDIERNTRAREQSKPRDSAVLGKGSELAAGRFQTTPSSY